jgi:hypothetical protein
MKPDFWVDPNWWVGFATAAATFLAVLAALFLDWFRARFFPPRLVVSLVSARGSVPATAFITVTPNQAPFQTLSRWYHLKVENNRRMSRASEVQVYLLEIGLPNAAGQIVTRSTGAIPFKVRHEGIVRPGRIIGPPVEFDLCSVFREAQQGGAPFFQLQTVVAPTDITVQHQQQFRMVLTLQARSIEVDSNIVNLDIAWNGQWSDDTDAMANFLVITEL